MLIYQMSVQYNKMASSDDNFVLRILCNVQLALFDSENNLYTIPPHPARYYYTQYYPLFAIQIDD